MHKQYKEPYISKTTMDVSKTLIKCTLINITYHSFVFRSLFFILGAS